MRQPITQGVILAEAMRHCTNANLRGTMVAKMVNPACSIFLN